MTVVFLIERRSYYRLFGPIIDRALERGWQIECWHDWSQPRTGHKGYDFPDPMPTFHHGRPALRTYHGSTDLATLLAAAPPDVVIALLRPAGLAPTDRVRWFGLQYNLDIGQMIDPAGRTAFDRIGMNSQYWWERTADCIRILTFNRARVGGRTPEPVDDAAVAETLRQRGVLVGTPQMDQHHWIDPAEVRRRLRIETGRPVVLYIPFQFKSIEPRTFWLKQINSRGRLWQQAAVWLARKPEYQPYVDGKWCDRGVVEALGKFCDANGAALVVKARGKDPVPRYLERRADRIMYDQDYYPATILELLKISALCCISSFSTVTYEAANAGVPSVCIAPNLDEIGFWPIWQEWFLNTEEGGGFNFPGVVYPVGLPEFVRDFPRRRISDFPLEPAARVQYVEKFVGFDDGKSSDRVLDAVQSLVEGLGGGGAEGVEHRA